MERTSKVAITKIVKSYYDDGTQGPQPGLKHLLPLSAFDLMRHKITHKWCLTERTSCLCNACLFSNLLLTLLLSMLCKTLGLTLVQ